MSPSRRDLLKALGAFAMAPQAVGILGRGVPQGAGGGGGGFSSTVVIDSMGYLTLPVAATIGQVPSGQGVHVAGFTSQTDVKQAWGDGSMRYGIVTCNATSTGTKALTNGAVSGSPITPTWPTCTVTFVITAGAGSGDTYVATLPSFSGTDSWLSGAVCREARVRVVPVKAGPTNHPNMVVVFDVRSFAGSGHRVDITVENCRDSASLDSSTYTAVVNINSSDVYDSSDLDWPSGLKHWSFTAWRKVFTTSLTEATFTMDFEPFYDAKLLYRPLAGMQSIDWASDPRYGDHYYFGPLRFGFLQPTMNGGGGRPELSPVPQWDLEFLAQQEPANLVVIKQNAEACAAWTSGRVYKNDGSSFYLIDDGTHNLMTYSPQSGGASYPSTLRAPTEISGLTGGPQFVGSRDDSDPVLPPDEVWPRVDNEHPPDCHVPYVVTGDRFYVDQIKHWSNLWLFRTALDGGATYEGVNAGRDYGSYDGCLASGGFRGTTRGFGRPLRILVQTANLLPDADTEKSTFINAANDNFDFLSGYNTTRTATGDPYHDMALFWEANTNAEFYIHDTNNLSTVTWSLLYTQGFGFGELSHTIWWGNETGKFTVPSGALSLADRMCQWIVDIVGSGSDATLPRDWALNVYYQACGSRDGISGVGTPTLTSGLSDFASRVKQNMMIFQGSLDKTTGGGNADMACSDSTTVTSASGGFTSAWSGQPVLLGGLEGSNWLENAFKTSISAAERISQPGIYVVQTVNSANSLTLDRKPVTNGTSATGGYFRSFAYPSAVIDYNGATTMLAIYVAQARGLSNTSAALTYANAYSAGGYTISDILLGTDGQGVRGYVGYGLDLMS